LRTFALLTQSGVSLTRSFGILEESAVNGDFRAAATHIRADLESGQVLSRLMSEHPDVFPTVLIALVRAGEVGGVLDLTLGKAVECAERETRLRDHGDNPTARRMLELSLWAWQWGTMLGAGVPILQSLETLAENTEWQELREATLVMRVGLREGGSLAGAMEQYPQVFPAVLQQVVAVGEATGKLDKRCCEVGDHLRDLGEEIAAGELAPEVVSPSTGQHTNTGRSTEETTSDATLEVERLLRAAIEAGATDLHLQPRAREVRVRLRVDGALRPGPDFGTHLPTEKYPAAASRLKLMAGLDLAERRLPQRGSVAFRAGGHDHDLRVLTSPTTEGEWVHVVFAKPGGHTFALRELGWEEGQSAQVEGLLRSPCGLLAVAGPHGSGRTTTLYAVLEDLNSVERSIVTLEDSLMRELSGVQQCTADRVGTQTPAWMLQTLGRQDPDVVMVDELREADTLQAAVDLAVTGHLVLLSVSAPDAASAAAQLAQMAGDPFMLSEALTAVVGQRLLRKVCEACAQSVPFEPGMAQELGIEDAALAEANVREGEGCDACGGTGVKGRTAAFEILPMKTGELRELIRDRAPAERIRMGACRGGVTPLEGAIACKVLRGEISLRESVRMAGVD